MLSLCLRILFFSFCISVAAATLAAQDRKYVIGATGELVGGATNHLGTNFTQNQPLFFFYGLYPSISFAGTGARSTLSAAYSFGMNRTASNNQLHSNSHAASL